MKELSSIDLLSSPVSVIDKEGCELMKASTFELFKIRSKIVFPSGTFKSIKLISRNPSMKRNYFSGMR